MKKLFVVLFFMTFSISEAYSKERNIADIEINTSKVLIPEQKVDCFDLAYEVLMEVETHMDVDNDGVNFVNGLMAVFYMKGWC